MDNQPSFRTDAEGFALLRELKRDAASFVRTASANLTAGNLQQAHDALGEAQQTVAALMILSRKTNDAE